MIYTLKELMGYGANATRAVSTSREIDGKWVPARPMDGPKIERWRAAWAVLRGHADAFTWPGNQREFL